MVVKPLVLVVAARGSALAALGSGLHEAGYSVVAADDGLAACKLAAEVRPSVIIVDQITSLLSVIDLCRALRDEAPPGASALIAVLASGSENMRVAALEAGCDDYVIAPPTCERLLSIMSRLAATSRPAGHMMLYGGFELDPGGMRVRFNGVPISLRYRSFQLLQLLLQMPEVPLSRQRILQEVGWRVGVDGDRIVDVQIGLLRRQLKSVGAAGMIHTLRGAGYMLSDKAPNHDAARGSLAHFLIPLLALS